MVFADPTLKCLLHSPYQMGVDMTQSDRIDVVRKEVIIDFRPASYNHKVGTICLLEPMRNNGTCSRFSCTYNNNISGGSLDLPIFL